MFASEEIECHLHPKDALGATLVDVNPTTGVEIAVSVCVGGDSAGVAQILIPVYFPNPCYDESDTCILENFQTLDEQAQDTIANMEWNDQYADQLAAQQLILQELREEPLGVDLPYLTIFIEPVIVATVFPASIDTLLLTNSYSQPVSTRNVSMMVVP